MISGTFYVSRTTLNFSDEAFSDLCRTSNERNASLGITGFLAHLNGRFFQYVEGPADAVADLIGRIGADPRHEFVRCVGSWPLAQRQFPEWSMHRLSSNDAVSAGMKSIMFSPSLLNTATERSTGVDSTFLENWDRLARNAIGLYARLNSGSGFSGDARVY